MELHFKYYRLKALHVSNVDKYILISLSELRYGPSAMKQLMASNACCHNSSQKSSQITHKSKLF